MEILDFFPFNLPSGINFILFYFSVIIAGWGAILFLRYKFSAKYDHDFLIENNVSKLTIGKIPEADDLIPIAYLGGSTIRAFRTLISSAVAYGWLQNDPNNKDKFIFIGKPKPDASRFCELDFFNAVDSVNSQLILTKNDLTSFILQETAAHSVNKNISRIEKKLEDAGLLRTRETKSKIAMASWIVGFFYFINWFS